MKYCYYIRLINLDSVSVKYVDTFNDVVNYAIKRLYHIFKNTCFRFTENQVKLECGVNVKYENTIIERKVIESDYLSFTDEVLEFLYKLLKTENSFYHQIANLEFENEK